jgi:hypothetical protein
MQSEQEKNELLVRLEETEHEAHEIQEDKLELEDLYNKALEQIQNSRQDSEKEHSKHRQQLEEKGRPRPLSYLLTF